MSVDTYLKGKRTDGYQRVQAGDVELLLSPKLSGWAARFVLDAGGFGLVNWFKPQVAHAHNPT